MTTQPARQADRPEDYARLDLERRLIKPWEDGIRIDTAAPNLEWWYIDADLDDGTGLCMIFATKDGTRPHQPLGPQLEIDITKPDGTRHGAVLVSQDRGVQRVQGRLRRPHGRLPLHRRPARVQGHGARRGALGRHPARGAHGAVAPGERSSALRAQG